MTRHHLRRVSTCCGVPLSSSCPSTAMGRRGGVRKSGMSHSIKKLMRRSAATGHLVKNTKAKSREPRHPGAKVVSFNAKRRAAAAGEEGEKQKMGVGSLKGGTERRIEMRKAMSKQARLEKTARRRGIVPAC